MSSARQLHLVPQARLSLQADQELAKRFRRSIEIALATAEGREIPRETRALLVAWRLLVGFQKPSDNVYLGDVRKLAGIVGATDRRELDKIVGDAYRKFSERGALLYRPSRRHGYPSWISLPELDEARREPVAAPLVNVPCVPPSDTCVPPSVVELHPPEGGTLGGRSCFIDDCREPVAGIYGGQSWCARHLQEQHS